MGNVVVNHCAESFLHLKKSRQFAVLVYTAVVVEIVTPTNIQTVNIAKQLSELEAQSPVPEAAQCLWLSVPSAWLLSS